MVARRTATTGRAGPRGARATPTGARRPPPGTATPGARGGTTGRVALPATGAPCTPHAPLGTVVGLALVVAVAVHLSVLLFRPGPIVSSQPPTPGSRDDATTGWSHDGSPPRGQSEDTGTTGRIGLRL